MKYGVKMTKDNWTAVKDGLLSLPKRDVLVGIPSAGNTRDDGGPIGNAAIGYIHEYGAPEANIPARPWLRPGIKAAQERITAYFKQAGQRALKGDKEGVTQSLISAGLTAQMSARRVMGSGIPPALAASTLRARRARGRTGTVPLIDTGDLQRHINYVVREVK